MKEYTKAAQAKADLVDTLERMAADMAADAKRMADFAKMVDDADAENLVGSCIQQNVANEVVRTVNLSSRTAMMESALLYADRLNRAEAK